MCTVKEDDGLAIFTRRAMEKAAFEQRPEEIGQKPCRYPEGMHPKHRD